MRRKTRLDVYFDVNKKLVLLRTELELETKNDVMELLIDFYKKNKGEGSHVI